ncbi:MAG TPA: hypothetical protein VFV46_02280 [Lacibacter sp.]|nr:hypothetical protein [Lacibacter sp.]
MRLFCFFIVMYCISCNSLPEETADKTATTNTNSFSDVEEVTGVVRALLPDPASFHLREAKKWYDATGENWLVLYETDAYITGKQSGATAKLAAILYQKTDSGFLKKWTMNDYIKDCELDITCRFYDNHLSITDLDSNHVAEIMLVYALSCKGDVSPNLKKLILYTNGTKYAIRGEELMLLGKDTLGGITTIDSSLQQLPQVIRDSARQHWQKFGVTKYQ